MLFYSKSSEIINRCRNIKKTTDSISWLPCFDKMATIFFQSMILFWCLPSLSFQGSLGLVSRYEDPFRALLKECSYFVLFCIMSNVHALDRSFRPPPYAWVLQNELCQREPPFFLHACGINSPELLRTFSFQSRIICFVSRVFVAFASESKWKCRAFFVLRIIRTTSRVAKVSWIPT